jgi:predicted solute-binding protein
VNERALTLGEEGKQALERLFKLARAKGLVPEGPPMDPL